MKRLLPLFLVILPCSSTWASSVLWNSDFHLSERYLESFSGYTCMHLVIGDGSGITFLPDGSYFGNSFSLVIHQNARGWITSLSGYNPDVGRPITAIVANVGDVIDGESVSDTSIRSRMGAVLNNRSSTRR